MFATHSRRIAWLTGFCLALTVALAAAAPGTKTITFADLMKFRAIGGTTISDDGKVIAYGLQPDRGDGEAVVHALATGRVVRVPLGGSPVISKDGRFVAMVVKLSFAASEKTGRDRPKPGMALVDVASGSVTRFENVERFAFSDDSRWLAYQLPAPEAKPGEKPASAGSSGGGAAAGQPAAAGRGGARPDAARAGGTTEAPRPRDGDRAGDRVGRRVRLRPGVEVGRRDRVRRPRARGTASSSTRSPTRRTSPPSRPRRTRADTRRSPGRRTATRWRSCQARTSRPVRRRSRSGTPPPASRSRSPPPSRPRRDGRFPSRTTWRGRRMAGACSSASSLPRRAAPRRAPTSRRRPTRTPRPTRTTSTPSSRKSKGTSGTRTTRASSRSRS